MNDEQKFVLEKNLTRFDGYINATNVKAAFLVSFNTFITGTILFKYDTILTSISSPLLEKIVATLLCLCLISVAVAIIKSFLAVNPFLKSGMSPEEKDTLFFFMSVAKMGKDVYIKRLIDLSRDDIYNDLIGQTYILANGAKDKFSRIRHSIIATMFGTITPLFIIAVVKILDLSMN